MGFNHPPKMKDFSFNEVNDLTYVNLGNLVKLPSGAAGMADSACTRAAINVHLCQALQVLVDI
jgi:hypothetical protein